MTQVRHLRAVGRTKDKTPNVPTRIEAIVSSNNIKITLKSKARTVPDATAKVVAADRRQMSRADHVETKPLRPAMSVKVSQSSVDPRFKRYRVVAVLALLVAVGMYVLLKGSAAQGNTQYVSEGVIAPLQDDFLAFVSSATAVDADTMSATVPTTSKNDERVAKLAAGTLTALRTQKTGKTVIAAVTQETANDAAAISALYRLVVTAHSQGQSMSYIDQMLNDAYTRGEVRVPSGLVTTDNRVDTKAILNLFIAQ